MLLASVVSPIAVKSPGRRRACLLLLIVTTLTAALAAGAEGLREFVEHLSVLDSRVNQGLRDPHVASDVINELDADEGTFAHFTVVSGENRVELLNAYNLLDSMLGRIYETYRNKHDACLTAIGNGSVDCDYNLLEQLELRALYPLSWLRFHGSILFSSPEAKRRVLKQAIAGFTQSALVIVSPELIRENLLGRAYCERDLGQFDRSHYAKAIADFREVMKAGPNSAQYRAAQQGLATTYAAMGEVDQAASITSHLSPNPIGSERQGAEMFRLQQLFAAEAEATDPARRAELHQEAVRLLHSYYGSSRQWPLALAAVIHNVSNPEAEFGASKDPFEQYLLAEVLVVTHRQLAAAKYYLAAARGGPYPQGYKYAIDIYYNQGKLDLIDAPLEELAAQRHNPMADWAAYMRFKIAHTRWERSGMKDPKLKDQWIARAHDYIDHFPHGRYAYEPRFRLAELLQRDGNYSQAASQYDQVKGDPFYDYAGAFKAAECRYLELGAAANHPAGKPGAMPANEKSALTESAIAGLRSTVANGPEIERRTPAERQFVHTARGRAAYMLVTMLEAQPQKDYVEIARLLDGFETDYPWMSAELRRTHALAVCRRWNDPVNMRWRRKKSAGCWRPDASPLPIAIISKRWDWICGSSAKPAWKPVTRPARWPTRNLRPHSTVILNSASWPEP